MNTKKHVWTPEMDQYLIDNYKDFLNKELSKHLGFEDKVFHIHRRLEFLNLKRSKAENKNLAFRRLNHKTQKPKEYNLTTALHIEDKTLYINKFGTLPNSKILVYDKDQTNVFSITKVQYDRLATSKNAKVKKQIAKIKRVEKEKNWINSQLEEKPQIKSNRNLNTIIDEESNKGRVAVRIDHKTIVFRKIK